MQVPVDNTYQQKRKRHNSIAVAEPIRKSRRLQEQASIPSPKYIKAERSNVTQPKPLPSPSASRTPPKASSDGRKRKAALLEDKPDRSQVSCELRQKRLQTSSGVVSKRIYHWVRHSRWPKGDFKATPEMLPAPKRSRSASSQDQRSSSVAQTPSDQKPREEKSAYYTNPYYEVHLEMKNSFMNNSEAGMVDEDKQLCKTLLGAAQALPLDTLFDDKYFYGTLHKIRNQNEQRVIRDIALLITPSAEVLTIRGSKKLAVLAESTNAGWNRSIPFQGPRPQPDYSVGFRPTTFSQAQLKKLNIQFGEKDYYTATEWIYFPFFTCEVKCGNQALSIADRQNAHSMTVAVRGVVKLYQTIERAKELHRTVLGFSISHDDHMVRIYAHYPETQGVEVRYYRHLIKEFSIVSEEGKERWAAYIFTRNVYDKFMPAHLERIRSGIDDLPDDTVSSFQSIMSLDTEEGPGSQGTVTAPPSQETGVFKKPAQRKASGTVAAEELARLTRMLEEEREERKQLKAAIEMVEQDRKREREKAEQEREKAEQEREKAEQERTELMNLLKRQISS